MFLNWTVLIFHSGVYIFSSDAILNMVNNIAVNVLGGGPEMQGMTGAITCNIQFYLTVSVFVKFKNNNDFCVHSQCKLFSFTFIGNLSSNMTEPSAQPGPPTTTTTTDLTSQHM